MSRLVAIVSRGWFCSIHGGSERFISKLAEKLHSKGFRIVGVTRWLPGFEYPKAVHELRVLEERRSRASALSSLRFSRWAARVVNELRPSVAIVNCYWGEAAPLFISRDIPVVAVLHDIGFLGQRRATASRMKNFLRARILKRVVSRANAVVVPSEAVKRDLTRYLGANPSKVRVLGFEGVEGPFRYVHEDNEWFDIVQVSRFAPNKGQHILLQAFKNVVREVPRARLWLVGGRSVDPKHVEYLNTVLAAAKEINRGLGEERVKIVVDAPSVEPYYRLADVCVAPSIGEEGYGLAVVECMAFGKPVIASDLFVETGVASEERAFVVPRGDPEALAKAIVYVYRNYDEAMKRAAKGLEFARSCSWDRVAEVFVDLMESLSGEGG